MSEQEIIQKIQWYLTDIQNEEIDIGKHYICKSLFKFLCTSDCLSFIKSQPKLQDTLKRKITEFVPNCEIFKKELISLCLQIFSEDKELMAIIKMIS